MATPKLDSIAVSFVAKIPDTLPNFDPTAGQVLPATANGIPAATIMSYVNRALQKLFNMYWEQLGINIIKLMPELNGYSDPVNLTSGNYTIANPNLDFYALIGAVNNDYTKYIRVKNSNKYTLYLTEEYDEYVPTITDPVIIQINRLLAVFPQTGIGQIRFQYVKYPVNRFDGNHFIQNDATEDSPFLPHWNENIADIAYQIFLAESNMTA